MSIDKQSIIVIIRAIATASGVLVQNFSGRLLNCFALNYSIGIRL